jgi:hypothetical protein
LIEDDYAKRLLKLSKVGLAGAEMGGLQNCLVTVRTELENVAAGRQAFAASLRADIGESLASFATQFRERRKMVNGKPGVHIIDICRHKQPSKNCTN